MTVSITTALSGPYVGNGVTVSFPFTFKAMSDDEVSVIADGVEVSDALYTVTRNAGGNGGTVTYDAAPTADEIYVVSDPTFAQDIQFENAGPFLPESHDDALDRAAVRAIYLKHGMERSLRAPPGDTMDELPPAADRAGMYQAFDASGQPIASAGTGNDSALRTDLAAATGSSLVRVDDDYGSPAYLKTLSDIVNGMPIDMFRFVSQAKINGIRARSDASDLAADFATALASGALEINLQPGLYNITTPIAMSLAGQRLNGAGPDRTEIKIASTTQSAITLANGVAGYGLRGLKITRTGVPGATAHGVEFLGTTDKSVLEWLVLEDHYNNLVIGTCDTGYIRNIESRRAYAYGAYQTNAAAYGPSQWDVDSVLVEKNAVDGWRVQVTDGPAGLIMGTMNNIRSFANGGRGIHLVGSATTGIYDFRLSNAFLGSDALACVRLDSRGGKHRMTGFFERAGRDPTGRTLATPATNTAPNIEISANNTDVMIYGSTIDDAAYDGVEHNGGVLIAAGNMIYNNGQAGTAGRRNGILTQGGRLVAGSNRIGNLAGSSQLYGVATSHDNVVVTGNDLSGNATGPYTLGATTNAVVHSNGSEATAYLPSTINQLSFNEGRTPTATGSFKGAGTLNVAGGLLKNDVAYVNP